MQELLKTHNIEQVLGKKYSITRSIGEGAFAWVFEATHVRIKTRKYAIKVLKTEHTHDPVSVQRFLREAETAALLQCPYVVWVADYGETLAGQPYIVMEYIEGTDIDILLRQTGKLPSRHVARLSLNILAALEDAHSHGIIHRDLKPSNVFVVEQPGVRYPIAKVGDFGIAKIVSADSPLAPSATQTAAGNVLCTPAYASPDLLRGEVTPLVDIYALGHMMAEMLDGNTPYEGSHPVLVSAQHLSADPVPLGPFTLDSGLGDIVAKAVAKDVKDRYASATEMRIALEAALAALPERDEPLPTTEFSISASANVPPVGTTALRKVVADNGIEETVAAPTTDSVAQQQQDRTDNDAYSTVDAQLMVAGTRPRVALYIAGAVCIAAGALLVLFVSGALGGDENIDGSDTNTIAAQTEAGDEVLPAESNEGSADGANLGADTHVGTQAGSGAPAGSGNDMALVPPTATGAEPAGTGDLPPEGDVAGVPIPGDPDIDEQTDAVAANEDEPTADEVEAAQNDEDQRQQARDERDREERRDREREARDEQREREQAEEAERQEREEAEEAEQQEREEAEEEAEEEPGGNPFQPTILRGGN